MKTLRDWRSLVAGCFGCVDLVFAGHPADENRAREMLKLAIDQRAKMDDILAEAKAFMESKKASASHIDAELHKIRSLDF